MKHFRKLISLLMTVTLVVSMIAMGFGSLTASADDLTEHSNLAVDEYGGGWLRTFVAGNDLELSSSTTYYAWFTDWNNGQCTVFERQQYIRTPSGEKIHGSPTGRQGKVSGQTCYEFSFYLGGNPAGTYTAVYYAEATNNQAIAHTTASYDFSVTCSHTDGVSSWTQTVAPTASRSGEEQGTCSFCGGTATREIPPVQYTFKKAPGSPAVMDNIKGLLYGIPEGTSNLAPLFTMVNCNLSYSSVGTGSVIAVKVGTETVKEMTAVIFGDVTGDGVVDSFDVSDLTSVVNFEREYDTLALNEAGDVFDDGYIDATDLAFEIAASVCDMPIDQRGVVEQGDDPQQDYQYSFMDYQYGPYGVRNLMDFSMPEGITGEVGLVFYVHGGSWIAGNKDGYRGAIANMNSRGYAAAAINYRYASATSGFDEMAVDINNALSAIKSLAAENGVSINKVMLVGDSAGAHISLLYSYTKASQAPITPVCVRGNASPADLTISRYKSSEPTLMEISCMAGTPTKVYKLITPNNVNDDWAQYYLREYSPSYHAGSGIPTLLCHGELDDGVPMEGAINLYAALTLNNIYADSVIYPHSGHELGFDPDCAALADEKMYDMMESYLPAPNMSPNS